MTTEIPLDRLVRVYRKIKDRISELDAAHEAALAEIKPHLDEVRIALKDRLQAMGVTSAKTDEGTVLLSSKVRYYAQDWDAMKNFIMEHGLLDLLEKRLAQTALKQYLEENPEMVPPGLNTVSEIDVSVRKNKS